MITEDRNAEGRTDESWSAERRTEGRTGGRADGSRNTERRVNGRVDELVENHPEPGHAV